MRFSIVSLISALMLLPFDANANPLNLQISHSPNRLRMRSTAVANTIVAVADDAGGGSLPSSSPTATWTAFPTSRRDLAERVTFRLNAGVQLDAAASSGTTMRGGYALSDAYQSSRPWITGDAMLASKGVLLPSMNAYLLSSFQFDAGNSIVNALPAPVDADGDNIQFRAGYVEWGRDPSSSATDLRKKLWLRGGRQFRFNGGSTFAYYDGATVGWREPDWQASAFVGRRVALYIDSPRGIVLGADTHADLKARTGWPVTAGLEYQGLVAFGEQQARHLVTARAEIALRKAGTVMLRARLVAADGNTALGRVGARLTYNVTGKLLVVADAELRDGGDLTYDLAAPSAVDVVDVARRLGVGLAAPVDAVTVGLRADYRFGNRELVAFGRAELPRDTVTTHDRTAFIEAGGAVASPLGGKTWANLQYLTRQRTLAADVNAAGGDFANTAGSGISSLHELALDAIWRTAPGASGTKWRASGGGFFRVYDGKSAYAEFTNDSRAGGRADVQYWINRNVHITVAGELAQTSPTTSRELSSVTSVRAAAEAQF
jgi:hypothetical protein